jgi:hypothetical protein
MQFGSFVSDFENFQTAVFVFCGTQTTHTCNCWQNYHTQMYQLFCSVLYLLCQDFTPPTTNKISAMAVPTKELGILVCDRATWLQYKTLHFNSQNVLFHNVHSSLSF